MKKLRISGSDKVLNRYSKQLLIYQIILLFCVQEVVSKHCPDHCNCIFSNKADENKAECRMNNSNNTNVYINWEMYENNVILAMNCGGINFNCSNMPYFDIDLNMTMLVMSSCSPYMHMCAYNMTQAIDSIHNVKLINAVGPYTSDSYSILNEKSLHNLWLLDETERRLPIGVFKWLNSLKYLKIQGTVIEHLRAHTFTGLSVLNELYLDNNQLKYIEPHGFVGLNELEHLFILRNMLLFLTNTFLVNFDKLTAIHIKDNRVNMTLDSHAFSNITRWINTINLTDCKLASLPEDVFSGSDILRKLHFPNNLIKFLPRRVFSTLPYLVEINFKNNLISMLYNNVFDKLEYLRKMDLSYNNITKLSGSIFAYNFNLREIYLNNNNINFINFKVFKNTYLRSLSVASNGLKHVIGYTSQLWKLAQLNLSDNSLSEFGDWFMDLNGLQYLDLSHNQINKIEERSIYFADSIKIDLRHNNISYIERNLSELETSITTKRNMTIYLSNNPLECNCELVTILKDWNDYGWLADYKEIICTDSDLKLQNIDVRILCEGLKQSYIASIGIRVMCVLILIITVTLIFARQKQIREYISKYYICYMKESVTDETHDVFKEYDVFISFAHQDVEFVEDTLLPKLEYEHKQKVCVHYRDWIVGELIPAQIVHSVENSRKTIIILTRNFLLSQWSYLEFRTAHDLSIREGRPKLIMILLDERVCKDENLHKDIKAYISLNTYLLWNDPYFWQKLHKVLPRHSLKIHSK